MYVSKFLEKYSKILLIIPPSSMYNHDADRELMPHPKVRTEQIFPFLFLIIDSFLIQYLPTMVPKSLHSSQVLTPPFSSRCTPTPFPLQIRPAFPETTAKGRVIKRSQESLKNKEKFFSNYEQSTLHKYYPNHLTDIYQSWSF